MQLVHYLLLCYVGHGWVCKSSSCSELPRHRSSQSIISFMCTPNAGLEREPEYLVKWVGKAHVHNEWVVEDILMKIAKRKFTNFKRRYEAEPVMLMQPAWLQPCTFLCRRPCQAGPGWEVLVKWCDLGYENATWEVSHSPPPVLDLLQAVLDLLQAALDLLQAVLDLLQAVSDLLQAHAPLCGQL